MKRKHSKVSMVPLVLFFIGSILVFPAEAEDQQINLTVPYYEQETPYYCGASVAQMWIDYHGAYVSQDTLYDYIRSNNIEGDTWYTDPRGLAECVAHYVDGIGASDNGWQPQQQDTAILGQVYDIAESGIPSASLVYNSAHWMIVKGAKYFEYGGWPYSVYGIWVFDPANRSAPVNNKYISADEWKTEYFTPITKPAHLESHWYNKCVTVNGWQIRSTDYAEKTKDMHLMADEEDNILMTGKTDLSQFALDEMKKLDLFQKELEGSTPGKMLYVHSLQEEYSDYYLIPFEKDDLTVVVVEVFIRDDIADFGSCMKVSSEYHPVPTQDEAMKALECEGYESDGNAMLVWKPCLQTISREYPLWQFETTDNGIKYVGFDQMSGKVTVYDELTDRRA